MAIGTLVAHSPKGQEITQRSMPEKIIWHDLYPQQRLANTDIALRDSRKAKQQTLQFSCFLVENIDKIILN